MASVTEESNEKHLTPWSDACARDGISNTPLSPYLDRELLYNKHLHVDGSKIEASGFTYTVPQPTEDLLRVVKEIFSKYVISLFGHVFKLLIQQECTHLVKMVHTV